MLLQAGQTLLALLEVNADGFFPLLGNGGECSQKGVSGYCGLTGESAQCIEAHFDHVFVEGQDFFVEILCFHFLSPFLAGCFDLHPSSSKQNLNNN